MSGRNVRVTPVRPANVGRLQSLIVKNSRYKTAAAKTQEITKMIRGVDSISDPEGKDRFLKEFQDEHGYPDAPPSELEVALAPALSVKEVIAPPLNIRKEMLEGENAVEAVRNYEQGIALQALASVDESNDHFDGCSNIFNIPSDGWCFYNSILKSNGEEIGNEVALKFSKEISAWLDINRSTKPPAPENIAHRTFEEKYNETVGKELIPVYGGEGNRRLTYDEYRELTTQTTETLSPKVWAEVGISGYAAADIKNLHIKVYNNLKIHVADYYPLIGKGTKVIGIFNENANHFHACMSSAIEENKDSNAQVIDNSSPPSAVIALPPAVASAPVAPAPARAITLAPAPLAVPALINSSRSIIEQRKKEGTNDKEITTFDEQKDTVLKQLKSNLDICQKECKKLEEKYKLYTSIEEEKTFEHITLPTTAHLIDLLVERVLDPSPDWRNKMDILVNIPHGFKSQKHTRQMNRGGDYLEALFQLIFAINRHPSFMGKYIEFYDIDNYKELTKHAGGYLYTKLILNSGGSKESQGISDITFKVYDSSPSQDKGKKDEKYKCGEKPDETKHATNSFYFFSVKGFLTEKSVKNSYDIPLLYQQIRNIKNTLVDGVKLLDTDINICVGVKNKQEFIRRVEPMNIGFLSEIAKKDNYKNVFGYKEIMDEFQRFRELFFTENKELYIQPPNTMEIREKVEEIFPNDTPPKDKLELFFHQELISNAVIDRIQGVKAMTGGVYDKRHLMCIGVLPRGGKSFIAGGIMKKYEKILNKPSLNVLFLTSAVTETISQFEDDLINKYSDFSNYQFIDIRTLGKPGGKQLNKEGNNFIFVSRQYATGSDKKAKPAEYNTEAEKCKDDEKVMKDIFLKLETEFSDKVDVDLFFFDEAHIGVTTENVQKTLKNAFDRFKVPVIFMTATYKKPSTVLESKEDLFIWDLFDISDMRKLPDLGYDVFLSKTTEIDVLNRYGDSAIKVLQYRKELGATELEVAKPYINFPDPVFIHPSFNEETVQKIKQSDGFLHSDTFKIQPIYQSEGYKLISDLNRAKDWGTLLVNRLHAKALRSYLTFDPDTTNAMKQIFQHVQMNQGTRPNTLDPRAKPFSALMFMPFTTESIGALCRIWASYLRELPYWSENFIILTLSELSKPPKPKKGVKPTVPAEEVPQQAKEEQSEQGEEAEEGEQAEQGEEAEEGEQAEQGEEAEEGEQAEEGEEGEQVEQRPLEQPDGKGVLQAEGGGYVELLQFGGEDACYGRGICVREEIKLTDLKGKIIEVEKEALRRNKSLLLISGDVAKMGISLPCVDIVFMMDSGSEPDDIIQKFFRALTDNTGKKYGYIVDVNPKRIIEALFIYDLQKDRQRKKLIDNYSNKERFNKIFERCNFGFDSFLEKGLSEGKIDYEDMMQQLKEAIIGNLEFLVNTKAESKIKDDIKEYIGNNTYGEQLYNIIMQTRLEDTKEKDKKLKKLTFEQGEEIKKKEMEEKAKRDKGAKKEKSALEEELKEMNKVRELAFTKIYNLQRTFINSMLFRNINIIWSDHTMISGLMKHYLSDKETAKGIMEIECQCKSYGEDYCKLDHNNMYERVFCEILHYLDGNKEFTKSVLDILENIFTQEPTVILTWNSYMEGVIRELEKNNIKPKLNKLKAKGGRFKMTRKKTRM